MCVSAQHPILYHFSSVVTTHTKAPERKRMQMNKKIRVILTYTKEQLLLLTEYFLRKALDFGMHSPK